MKRKFRLWHKWIGLISCLFILCTSLTALALNHRDLWLSLDLEASEKAHTFTQGQAQAWAANPFDVQHYLGADQHHLFESHDAGQHWEELKLYLPAEHITGIAFSTSTQDILWIALRDIGIFYSDDGGHVWDELNDLPFDPVGGEQITFLSTGAENQLFVKTTLAWYRYLSNQQQWQDLSQLQNKENRLKLQDWVWKLHTGSFWGALGLYLYDITALCLVFLAFSGIWISLRYRPKKHLVHEDKTN